MLVTDGRWRWLPPTGRCWPSNCRCFCWNCCSCSWRRLCSLLTDCGITFGAALSPMSTSMPVSFDTWLWLWVGFVWGGGRLFRLVGARRLRLLWVLGSLTLTICWKGLAFVYKFYSIGNDHTPAERDGCVGHFSCQQILKQMRFNVRYSFHFTLGFFNLHYTYNGNNYDTNSEGGWILK